MVCFDVAHHLDRALKRSVNRQGQFSKRTLNKSNISKMAKESFALWNRQHPDNPVD